MQWKQARKKLDRQLSGKILPLFFLLLLVPSVENTLGMNEKDKRLPKHLIQLEMQIQRDRLTFAVHAHIYYERATKSTYIRTQGAYHFCLPFRVILISWAFVCIFKSVCTLYFDS